MISAFQWRLLSPILGMIGTSGCMVRGTRAEVRVFVCSKMLRLATFLHLRNSSAGICTAPRCTVGPPRVGVTSGLVFLRGFTPTQWRRARFGYLWGHPDVSPHARALKSVRTFRKILSGTTRLCSRMQ